MFSNTFTLSGKGSTLNSVLTYPLRLDPRQDYYIALSDLETYNSLKNVSNINQVFAYINKEKKNIILPPGAYEIRDIEHYLQKELGFDKISLSAINSTGKCELKCAYKVIFSEPNSIASLLGFDAVDLEPNISHISHSPVNISPINTILVECNLASGSFIDGNEGRILHSFPILVPYGFRISEVPIRTYLPITTRFIDQISVTLRDQTGIVLDLNEIVTVRLHLKNGLYV